MRSGTYRLVTATFVVVLFATGSILADTFLVPSGHVVGGSPLASSRTATTDTDGDGLSDSEEREEYDTDPSVPDTDNDGLSDYEEVHEYNTVPYRVDTDGDGYGDGKEVDSTTDPRDPDSHPGLMNVSSIPIPVIGVITVSCIGLIFVVWRFRNIGAR